MLGVIGTLNHRHARLHIQSGQTGVVVPDFVNGGVRSRLGPTRRACAIDEVHFIAHISHYQQLLAQRLGGEQLCQAQLWQIF